MRKCSEPTPARRRGPLLARIADLQLEAAPASDAGTSAWALTERADILSRGNHLDEAAAVLETARSRLGDGDGLDIARRRALLVTIMRMAANIAGRHNSFPPVELCSDAIAEFEQDRGQVNQPYLQDSYLRDRVTLYQLGSSPRGSSVTISSPS